MSPGAPDAGIVDLTAPRRIHIVGIGGTGMSVIAEVLVGMGHAVTGSDVAATRVVERLRALGAVVRIGHDGGAIEGTDLVTSSSAVPADNVELVAAARMGIPVLRRGEILAAVCTTRRTLAVSGTHGKTTTSSMLFSILRRAGLRPSCIIGGDLHGMGSGAVWDAEGDWLVVEADESDGTFLELPADGVIVTNVESDHLEFYGGLEPLRAAFGRFVEGASCWRVASADDPGAVSAVSAVSVVDPAPQITTFGFSPSSTLQMSDVRLDRAGASFTVTFAGGSSNGEPESRSAGRVVGRVELGVPGLHNARNAAGALTLALRAGIGFETAAAALGDFREVARRFEWRGEQDGVGYIDDYGHLPSEVKAALATARTGGWERVVAVFQPHRYSRTEALHAEFADAFVDADIVVLTGIYPAGESPRPGVTGELISAAVRGAHPEADVRYFERRADLPGRLGAILRPGDLCITLGAGNLDTLATELMGKEQR